MNENQWNSAVNAYNSSMASLTQTVQNLNQLSANEEAAQEQRDWSEKMLDKQNDWSLNMWNRTNEYNSPSAQLQRLKDAGLNPLYYGLDGSSAQAFQSAQALGYERANVGNMPNPVQVGSAVGLASAQAKSAQKDIELKNAQIDQLKQNTEGLKLDNEFKDRTMEARVESENLVNSLTRKQIDEAGSRIKVNVQNVKESIERTKNEVEKRGLILAEKALDEAKAKEILEMLPYQKLLSEAQTQAQKASAASSYASAAINRGLFEAGYVDKQIDILVADIKQKNAVADSAEAQKAINDWKLSVRNGTVFDVSSYSTGVQRFVAQLADGFFGLVSTASEAVGGGLSGFLK